MFWKCFLGSTKLYIIYVCPKRFVKDLCFLEGQWNNFVACFDKADLCYIGKEMLQHKACMPCEARLKKNSTKLLPGNNCPAPSSRKEIVLQHCCSTPPHIKSNGPSLSLQPTWGDLLYLSRVCRFLHQYSSDLA